MYTLALITLLLFESARAQNVIPNVSTNSIARSETTPKEVDKSSGTVNEKMPLDSIKEQETLLSEFTEAFKAEQEKFEKSISDSFARLDEIRKNLDSLTNGPESNKKISARFLAVDDIWRASSSALLSSFSDTRSSSQLSLPDLLAPNENESTDDNTYQDYIDSYNKVRADFLNQIEKRNKLILDLKTASFRLVSDSGKLRATLISSCKRSGNCADPIGFNERTITGIATEFRIMPLRFLAGAMNKWVELRAKVTQGIDGWIDIIRQILVLCFLVLLPFLVHKALGFVSSKLNDFRSQILTRSLIDYRQRTQAGIWISRINPFVPSLGMVLSIHIARALIETTDLKEISSLLYYLEVYFIYRAARILFKFLIEVLFSTQSLSLVNGMSEKAERSARRLSRFIFGRFLVLHIIEDTVRQALVYSIAKEILLFVGIILLFLELRLWKSEITKSFQIRFNSVWVKIENRVTGSTHTLILPLLLAVVIGHDLFRFISHQLIKFDFFKRFLSEVFRKKLEQDIDESQRFKGPSEDYLSLFDYYLPAKDEFYVDREPLMAKKIVNTVENWLAGKTTEDLVVLVGNRGIGKTTSAQMIFQKVSCKKKVFKWAEPKITHPDVFFAWLSEIMGTPIRSVEEFAKFEMELDEKVVLILDDIHNLFLGKIGGFEAFRKFMEVVSLKTSKIFWCLTANSHAWTYLRGVFGDEYFYGKVFEMRMWTDAEIQNLILSRHKLSKCSRTFDHTISAYGAGNVLGEQVETQFFRLLWGQARGNPRSALMYWISAITQSESGEVHVGVPKFINSNVVGTMSSEALITLAAIAKHDSLTQEEIVEVTGIDKMLVRKVIKESIEKDLLWSDSKARVRISSRAQNAVDYYLIGKNFLYE